MKKARETLAGYAFLSPVLLVFSTLVVFPVVMSAFLAFTKWNFLSGLSGIRWVNITNFTHMFAKDDSFRTALINTIVYAVATVPVTVFMGLLLAHVLNGRIFFKKFFRFAFFITYISNIVALGAVFKFLFAVDGPINMILVHIFHLQEGPSWLSSSTLSRFPIICIMIYTGIGFCLIIYMAALRGVPKELYDASAIDGASPVKQFFSITIPYISPSTFYLIVVRMIVAFQVFAAINIITSGGKAAGNVSLVVLIFEEAFKNYSFGYASAIAWVLVLFILAVTLIQFWGQKKWVNY